MSSSSPAGNSSSTASQLEAERAARLSETWWSSQTCGVWRDAVDRPPLRHGPPPAAAVSGCRRLGLVQRAGEDHRHRRAARRRAAASSSRSTRTPLTGGGRGRPRAAPAAGAPAASKAAPGARSTASRVSEVKSPTTSSTCGWSGRRLNSVRLIVKRGLSLQAASTSAKAASSTPEGVSPARRARVLQALPGRGGRAGRCGARSAGAASSAGLLASGSAGAGGSVARRSRQ